MEIFIVWFFIAAMMGAWANAWGRSGGGFFLISLLLSPIVCLIWLLVAGNKTAQEAATAKRDSAQRMEHERQLESIRAITKAATPAAPTPAMVEQQSAPGAATVADEILKLGELKQRGLLTDAEFAEQKGLLLASRRPPAAATPAAVLPPPPPAARGYCPNCNAVITIGAPSCSRCNASFEDGSAWKVKPL